MHKLHISRIFIVLLATFSFIDKAKSDVIFDSITGKAQSGTSNISSSVWRGQQFQTGNNSGGYTLGNLVLDMQANTGATKSDLVAQIFNDSSNLPGSAVATLTYNANDIQINILSNVTFSGGDFFLSANSKYWVVLGSNTSSNFAWGYTDDDISPYDPLNARSTTGATSWVDDLTSPYRMIVNATAVPEPGTMALGTIALASGGFGTWWRRKRQAKAENPN